ncbi:hypothetical protein C7Q13_01155 [Staphylococcus aureus]|nr:hypothetical protein C7Q13_01155 [Staphylococcus aureus]
MIFSQNLFRRPTPARLTRIEKSLLQAHFRSVNYCQYNFVEHRTLIYVPASSHANSQKRKAWLYKQLLQSKQLYSSNSFTLSDFLEDEPNSFPSIR